MQERLGTFSLGTESTRLNIVSLYLAYGSQSKQQPVLHNPPYYLSHPDPQEVLPGLYLDFHHLSPVGLDLLNYTHANGVMERFNTIAKV